MSQDTVINDSLPQSQPPEQNQGEYGSHMHILICKICHNIDELDVIVSDDSGGSSIDILDAV